MNAVELTTGPIFPGIPCEPCFPFLPSKKKKDYISSLTFSIFAKCSKWTLTFPYFLRNILRKIIDSSNLISF